MKTQYYTATSLDGYIADGNNSLDWLFQLGDPEDSSYPEFIAGVGALAMGSTTYLWLLEHASKEPWAYEQPAWVFTSRQLPLFPGADIRFVCGDVRPVHEAMRAAAGDKNIWVVGGGELVGKFYDAGLLDELFVQIASVTLGSGAPVLPRTILHPALKLLSARGMGPGFAELHYEVARKS